MEEVDLEEKAKSGRNEPGLKNFEFNFDIDNDGPVRQTSLQNDIFDLVDKPMDEPENGGIPPPLPQSMIKQSSLIKTGDKANKKKKGTLKVGFSVE